MCAPVTLPTVEDRYRMAAGIRWLLLAGLVQVSLVPKEPLHHTGDVGRLTQRAAALPRA